MIKKEYVIIDYKGDILPLLYPIIEEIDNNPGYYTKQ
jgi:hypothetical protein